MSRVGPWKVTEGDAKPEKLQPQPQDPYIELQHQLQDLGMEPQPQLQEPSFRSPYTLVWKEELEEALEAMRDNPWATDTDSFRTIWKAYEMTWDKIWAKPMSYKMTWDEFGVFNYFQHLHNVPEKKDLARKATARFWTETHGPKRAKPLRYCRKSPEGSVARSYLQKRAIGIPKKLMVAQPVLTRNGPSSHPSICSGAQASTHGAPSESCSVLLMEHVFGFSYGMPFVGNYTPPDCDFDRVVINFTVVSQGRQFDRIALMYFGDTEVWRTSTAEPTLPPGIRWTFIKDMTQYMYFWKSPQKLIFDLGNLIDDKYTGSFNTTLTATFFTARVEAATAPPADLIVPISARKGQANGASHFTLPADNASSAVTLPQNVKRAVFSISANGQASEEFWWANVLQSDVLTFRRTAGQLAGLSPFREVQLLIDGKLAGVQWPFPVIFTGGVVPGLHRPIVGLQAFDLREHQIDITPWLPVLCDGAEHTFAIKIAGLNTNESSNSTTLTDTVNNSWYVTGKVFLWLDEEGSVTTGTAPIVDVVGPTISLSRSITKNETGLNETLAFHTVVSRTLVVKSTVKSKNRVGESNWSQTLSYSNNALMSNFGLTELNNFTINGVDVATGPTTSYTAAYRYPLYCNQTYMSSSDGNLTISAQSIEGLELQVRGSSVFPTGLEAFGDGVPYGTSHLKTYRDGKAFFFRTANGTFGHGNTNQIFHFGGSRDPMTPSAQLHVDELYFRNVTAVNGSVVSDSERVEGAETYSLSRPTEIGAPFDLSRAFFADASEKTVGLVGG
ncbi:peptide N-acetyl-beta-D-glucosaminyl asparaginase amidase A-domain-containing protein [Hypoxylon sp. FL1284]|nr:peptide N-acetyl-beta-D-glucosaminyl asparaginase amidase A-domain-containing protein [Hypoxylon sp. FL1284]